MKYNKFPLFYKMCRLTVIKPTLRFLFDFEIQGKENIPRRGPGVIVSKHWHWLDLFAICASVPPPLVYMAKQELFANMFGDFPGTDLEKKGKIIQPLTAKILEWMGAVPIDREHPQKTLSSIKQMMTCLRQGELVVVFPEGRTFPGEMGEIKPGLIQIALKVQKKDGINLPFYPVGISYSKGEKEKISEKNRKEKENKKDSKYKKKLIIKYGEPLYFSSHTPISPSPSQSSLWASHDISPSLIPSSSDPSVTRIIEEKIKELTFWDLE